MAYFIPFPSMAEKKCLFNEHVLLMQLLELLKNPINFIDITADSIRGIDESIMDRRNTTKPPHNQSLEVAMVGVDLHGIKTLIDNRIDVIRRQLWNYTYRIQDIYNDHIYVSSLLIKDGEDVSPKPIDNLHGENVFLNVERSFLTGLKSQLNTINTTVLNNRDIPNDLLNVVITFIENRISQINGIIGIEAKNEDDESSDGEFMVYEDDSDTEHLIRKRKEDEYKSLPRPTKFRNGGSKKSKRKLRKSKRELRKSNRTN